MDEDKLAANYPGLTHQPGAGRSTGRLRQVLRGFMRRQFGRPSGLWGAIVGVIMAIAPSNRERIRWTLERLNLQPGDRILEVGFGPGFAVAEAVKRLPEGFVAGVDHSEVMVRQATRRNAMAIRCGRVDLRLGPVATLPVYGTPFDKVFTINSIHFWAEPVERLRELRERLKPGGLIAVTLQPRSRGSTAETAESIGRELVAKLETAGFKKVRLEFKHARPAPIVCVLGTR